MEDFISEITISGSRIDEDQAWQIDRIQRVIGYAQALTDIDDNEFLLKAIIEINDNKGILTVYWKENPKPEYKKYFDKAWESIVAVYESEKVEHQTIIL